jgi:hypothetical protein
VIARKERPHPGAQLRLTDVDGHRITAFATNSRGGQLPDLELRHRRRARAEDRIRNAKDMGLTNFPLHDFDQNRIWCALVGLAAELTAWMQLLAFTDHVARRWEPKRLRYRIFTIAAQYARTGRRALLHLATRSPGPGWSPTASTGSAHSRHPAEPRTHPYSESAHSGTVEPGAQRGDTRRTVTPTRHNQTRTAGDQPEPRSTSPR